MNWEAIGAIGEIVGAAGFKFEVVLAQRKLKSMPACQLKWKA
jgi:hypothetical protein